MTAALNLTDLSALTELQHELMGQASFAAHNISSVAAVVLYFGRGKLRLGTIVVLEVVKLHFKFCQNSGHKQMQINRRK